MSLNVVLGAPIARLTARVFALALASTGSAHAVTVVVGVGAGCTHSSVQQGIDAAESAAEASVVRITRSASYMQQALTVDTNQLFEITGGYANCTQAVNDNVKTTLDGAGGAAASVLHVITRPGGRVILRRLRIQNGDVVGDLAGGGIFFGGDGALEIHDSDVINNTAGNGGGIYAGGAVPGVEFVIGANVTISGNLARFSGGGVFADGLTMTMLEPGSIIFANSALGTSDTGYGGGLVVRALDKRSALARIGSGGSGTLGTISNNEARAGGGIAVLGNDCGVNTVCGDVGVELFTKETGNRAAVRDNVATVAGGGIFVEPRRPTNNFRAFAIASLWNAELTGNTSQSGAAIYLANVSDIEETSGGVVNINRVRPQGALPCGAFDANNPCGAIRGNVAQLPNGTPSDGAVIQVQRGARARIGSDHGGVALTANRGGRLIDVQPEIDDVNPTPALELINAVVADNEFSIGLLRGQGCNVVVHDTTVAGNTVAGGALLAMNANLDLRRSILWQPGLTLLSQSGGTRAVSGVIASENVSLGGAPLAIVADPRFVDPERGDYALHASSPAVDFLPEEPWADATGGLRNIDLHPKPNAGGPRDAGALERRSIVPLVRNGSFNTDLRFWQALPPATVEWQSVGAFGLNGSVRISDATNLALREVVGLRQCVFLPGPGFYVAFASAFGEGFLPLTRDRVKMRFRYFPRSTSDDCTGTSTAEGETLFPLGGGSSFNTPLLPMPVIPVSVNEFNDRSQVEVSLMVVDGDTAGINLTAGQFDEIDILPVTPPDALFRDGFEL
jgi:hypothetical protein